MKCAMSPYLPGWEYIPDGEPHVFGDRIYIFGSHDKFNGKAFCLNDYVTWSAPINDLANWRYEGVIYRKEQDPGNPKGKYAMWAPDVCRGPDGRYYLYYCLGNQWKIGVAVCDTPAGQYEFLGYVHDKNGVDIGARPDDTRPFDPGILVDDDGRIHLYSGQCPLDIKMAKRTPKTHKWAYHMELEPDMLTVKGELTPIVPNVETSAGTGFEGHEIFEGSSIRKFHGRYYFIYSSVLMHELCWSVSDRPDGGFRYGGTLISNGDIGLEGPVSMGYNSAANPKVKNYIGNNHGSVEKIGDEYFVFYHRQTNRHMFSRQACVAKIQMLPDGSFTQAEMTSCGLSDALPGKGIFEARIACQLSSAKGCVQSVHPMVQNKKHPAFTQDEPDGMEGKQYIANLRDGSKAVYKYFNLSDAKIIRVTVRGKCKGSIAVFCDGKAVAEIPLQPCRDWKQFAASFKALPGRKALTFRYQGRGYADLLNFTLE